MIFVRWLAASSEVLRRVTSAFCLVAMSVVVCDVLFGIVARAVMTQPPVWTEELARYLFVWVTFLGATAIYPTGENIVVDLILRIVPPRAIRYLSVFAHVIVGVTAIFMVTQGIAIIERTMAQRSSVMQVPFGLIYSAIPISGAILIVHTASASLRALTAAGPAMEPDQPQGW
jgi:TRAP-type transport system small permease protein